MSNLINRFRSGAGKATFEADKLRRVTGIQTNIRSLKQEFNQGYFRVGRIAFKLFGEGEISQQELLEACDQLATLQSEIEAKEVEIEAIRAEVYFEDTEQALYGHICPNGHGQLTPQDKFCQICGAEAVDLPAPEPTSIKTAICSNCGTRLAPDAAFCASCGQKVSLSSPPEQSSPCPECGASLLLDAMFCTECGFSIVPAENDDGP